MSRPPAPPSPTVVLVVEDEGLVRMMATEMLEEAGFVVLEASDADEAMAILAQRDDIGALFTDVDMPGSMDGFALAQRVAEMRPHVRLVITSGRIRPSNEDVPDSGQFVPKPYLMEQLLDAFASAGGQKHC
ncbi:response regulator receiver protein [Methylobacterium sp. 4-46]|uniref:response regulator n=2 Tax=unclassified Methylobacterium TaxID=2615210 RepID=UPI000152BF54|nr:response regulator [Methylobacterium sp. 4-46]ACA18563.1 response regulator receiver protein [Methylobacterium sp. 4-46]